MEVRIFRIRTSFVTDISGCLEAAWILNGVYRTIK